MERPRTRLSGPVLDAADAIELARFYETLLGWTMVEEFQADGLSWAKIESPGGDLKIEFQGLADYVPPVWPTSGDEQQMMMHLDVAVDDLDNGTAWAVGAGATVAEHQPREGIRVMLDPAGHPFCLFPGKVV